MSDRQNASRDDPPPMPTAHTVNDLAGEPRTAGERHPRRDSPTGSPALDGALAELRQADVEQRERVVESRTLHRGRYLTFTVDTIERPDGGRTQRDLAGHPGAVAILALDDRERLLLVQQYRLPAGRSLLEIPAGTLERRDDGWVENADDAAPRELEEETGYRAEHLERLAGFWTAPGFASEYMTLYLATGLRPADEERLRPDEDERLDLVRLDWRYALQAVETGVIEDAKSILGILLLAQRLENAAGESGRSHGRRAPRGRASPAGPRGPSGRGSPSRRPGPPTEPAD